MVKPQQQKLGKRNTYTPLDVSQVHRPVIMSLNKEETLSKHNLKTSSNNLDVNQQSGKTEQNLRVFVLNMRGKPLMPCKPAKARHLLNQKKAKVVSCKPFIIQMIQAIGETKQEIKLGIDPGLKYIGFSATTKISELISGEFELRTDVSKKLQERSMYRKNKRNKLWYRKPRFLNRIKSKKQGWLAPSVMHKINSHIRLIEKIKRLLPVSDLIIESSQFDVQKMQNPSIRGKEYQEGQMKNYENVKMFVRHRDNYTCQICKKKNLKNDGIIEVHHIIQRKNGGSDRPDNLITLHEKCHKGFHLGKIKHKFIKPKSYKEATMMNSLWCELIEKLKCNRTFGYITKFNRQKINLEKSHINDAFIISGGINQDRCKSFIFKQRRRNNRCLQLNRKGFKPSIRRKRYKFQPFDLVKFKNKLCRVKGVFSYGKQIKLVDKLENIFNSNIKNVSLIQYGKGIQFIC